MKNQDQRKTKDNIYIYIISNVNKNKIKELIKQIQGIIV